jgi:site-specific recombinase XerD
MGKEKLIIKLPESAENFLRHLKARNKSLESIDGYTSDLRIFFDFITTYKKKKEVTNRLLKNITLKDLDMFMSYLNEEIEGKNGKKKPRNSANTRARKLACIKSYFKYLYRVEKIITDNVAEDLEAVKIPDKEVIYLNKDQAKQLLNSVNKESVNYWRDLCILTVFLNTGLRLSELQGLRIDMIKDDEITIIGKGQKKREVFLNDDCLKSINEYLENRNEDGFNEEDKKYLFLSYRKQRITKAGIERMVKDYLKKAGFGEEFHTHTLRASFCTNVYNSGEIGMKTLQDLMGHSLMSTTQRYLGTNKEEKRKAVKNIY